MSQFAKYFYGDSREDWARQDKGIDPIDLKLYIWNLILGELKRRRALQAITKFQKG
jgi:hypothetical protein